MLKSANQIQYHHVLIACEHIMSIEMVMKAKEAIIINSLNNRNGLETHICVKCVYCYQRILQTPFKNESNLKFFMIMASVKTVAI